MSQPDVPNSETRCGYIAFVGRPNVGKSTLLNHLLGQKISITSRKPQTTRNNVLGIKTDGPNQLIFVDTPGLHLNQPGAINKYMNRAAGSAIKDVDVVVFLVDKTQWTAEDEAVAQRLENLKIPLIIAINKCDQIEDKSVLLPYLEKLAAKLNAQDIVPISALRGMSLDRLESILIGLIPRGVHLFPEHQITDRSSRFLTAEIVREKITRQLGAELPYQMAVEIEEFEQDKGILHVSAVILVEREGQKRILIGDKGDKIKLIGQQARLDIESLFETKVMLKLWVKVKSGWSDDERALRSLGYDDL